MILVDSSVWIDFFRDVRTWQADTLGELIKTGELVMGDLIMAEVLQGFRRDTDARRAETLLSGLSLVSIAGGIAVEAARNYRHLRGLGITVRSTIDVLIATHCIANGVQLLHSDRDFDPFEQQLGLSVVARATH